jgi:hypothetical protein
MRMLASLRDIIGELHTQKMIHLRTKAFSIRRAI